MSTLSITLVVLAGLALVAYLAVYSFGRFSSHERGEPSVSFDTSEGPRTSLDKVVGPLLERHPGESGLKLISGNMHAFAVRAAAARNAGRSLDLQYYYWLDDLTGRLLANEVLLAADRGVRVRLLLDDINAYGRDANYCAFDAHPNVEVRLFNPCRSRDGPFRRGLEMLIRYYSVVRRMHNKAWIVDGRIAIVGGRNIGDAYFDAAETSNFRDMDLLVVGSAVQQAETIFDAFWNSGVVVPIKRLAGRQGNLPKLRKALEASLSNEAAIPYLGRVLEENDVQDMMAGVQKLHWTDSARVVSDPPEKACDGKRDNWLTNAIIPAVRSAQKQIEIVSPYFIPGEDGLKILLDLAARGVSVSVLTNSLAATDVSAVHGAYARYRKRLVEGGIRLFELRPRDARQDISLFGSSGASLHTKAFTVDRRTGFVGSFNFDPRSASLNTEMGIMFDHEGLASEVGQVFSQEVSPRRSYRVVLGNGAIGWEDGPVGAARILMAEPEASLRRRMIAMLVGLLPIEEQL